MTEAEKILLLWKDDEDMVKMFSFFFQEHGYFIESVVSDEKCFELCAINPPHVLLINCSFSQPNITLEFVRKFRSYPKIPYVPIVVGNVNFADRKEEDGHMAFFKVGVNACFGHVFDVEDVLKQVKLLIEKPKTVNLVDKNTALWYGNSKAE